MPFIGRPITNNANCPTAQVDAYGHSIKTVTGATGDGTRRLHDSMNDGTSIWFDQAGIPHIGGCNGLKHTCKDLFSYTLNSLPENDPQTRRFVQGIIPDMCVDGTGRELDEKAKKVLGDHGRALFDWKTLAPGKAYSETASTEFAAVANKRQIEVTRQYRTTAKHLDAKLGTPPDEIGPVETELNTYNSGAVVGLVAGAFGEMSEGVHCITSFIASELASDHLQFFALDPCMVKSIFLRRVRRSLGLRAHRGWAKLLLDRTRDLVQHPNQPRNARTTDEDDAEAHTHYHQTHPPGRNGV